MTRDQKKRLAAALINQASQLVEYWDEKVGSGYYQELADIDADEAAQQIADWLGRLPGEEWNTNLPQPSYSK